MYYNRTEIILEAYPNEFQEVIKARGAYICKNSFGQRWILKEFSGTETKAALLGRYLSYLKEQGVVAEQLEYTKEELPVYTDVDGTKYYLRKWFEGRECDVRSREEVLCAVQKLASLHKISAGFDEKLPETMCRDAFAQTKELERHNKELLKVRNYIKSKK